MYNAGLTERQTEAVAWVYGADVTQSKAAEIMGIAQKNVKELIDAAAKKLAAVYRKWDYGEVTVEYVDCAEEEAA